MYLRLQALVPFQDRRRMQYLNPGPSSQNGFHLTNHRQLETDEIQTHIRWNTLEGLASLVQVIRRRYNQCQKNKALQPAVVNDSINFGPTNA